MSVRRWVSIRLHFAVQHSAVHFGLEKMKRFLMKKNLWLLAIAQGLFLTNNVVFIAINGLVGLALARWRGWRPCR